MKETIICVSTPSARTYYKAVPLAKEFLDKEQNIVNTTGELPDGEITEFNVSSATVKHLLAGKLNGKFEVINLADNTVTYSEEYENGRLVSITERNLQKPAADKPKDEKAAQLYPGTVLKSTKNANSFYINGQEVAEETLSSNGATLEILGTIPDGEVKEFYENGQVKTEAHYKENKLNGPLLRYDENGALLSREEYVSGVLQGPAEYFTPLKNDVLHTRCSYKNSFLEGERTVTQKNGGVRQQEQYKHGRLNGKRTAFYTNGLKESEENFTDGKLNGERLLYFPSGALWYRENYNNGRLDGERFGYFASGKIRLEEFYTEGLLEGKRNVYAENGELLTSEEYHWGSLVHNTDRKAK